MRIGGIITVLILIGLFFASSFFFTDEWIEEKVEYQASVINEALVEIDGLEFDLYGLSISWDRMQVANARNTMENTFETGRTEFRMEFWPLVIANKVIVDQMQLTGFRISTERETDGYFEMPSVEEGEEPSFLTSIVQQVSGEAKRNASVTFTDVRDDLNVDSLMAKVNIQSVDKIDSLRNAIEQNYATWDSTFKNTQIDDDVDGIRSTLEGIKTDDMKDPKKVVSALENVKKLRAQVDSLKSKTETLKRDFEEDYGDTRNDISQVDNWIQADYQRALTVAKLPDLDVKNIGKALFGQNLLGDYAVYLGYIAMAREYGSKFISGEEDEEQIPRYEGLDYDFSNKYDLPGLWLKNIDLSGYTKSDIQIAGNVTNISSDQKKTGEPAIFALSGGGEGTVQLKLDGSFNYLGDKPEERFRFNYDGFTLSKARLSGSDLLPYKLNSGTGSLNVEMNIVDKRIDSRIDYLAGNLDFDFASAGQPKNRIQSLIRDAIGSTDEIDVTALVDNTEGPLRVRVRSNVDDLFMNALRKTVSAEIEKARAEVRAEVEKQVAGKKQELEALKAEKEAELRKRYEALRAKVDEQLQLAEQKKKELEEKKKELENALKDKIKNKIGIDF